MADIAIRQQSPTAFYIKVDPTDNVAIIVNDRGLTAGTRFPDGLTPPMVKSSATAKSLAMPYAISRREAGLTSRWWSCPPPRR